MLTNPYHCGACGMACGVGELCVDGACACQGGTIRCGSACVDLASSGAHCGGCGLACPPGSVCSNGTCAATCAAGQAACGQSCVNGASDPTNCGSCGVVCPTGQRCEAGVCRCPLGQSPCGSTCADLFGDATNCGTCGNVCMSGASCAGGTCLGGLGGTVSSGGQAPGGSPTGGVPANGGAPPTGGVPANGGAPTTGGVPASGGAAPTGGVPGSGGAPAGGGASPTGGASPAGGTSPAGGASGTGGGATLEPFSFFVTSLEAMQRLSGSPDGFGGDLRYGEADGLAGADKICTEIAEYAMPGSGAKGWRAFLSAAQGPAGGPVHAIDRIGDGPWYDRMGRILAASKADLLNTRPRGADAAIIDDLPNEYGVPNHDPDGTGDVDNHHFLTGSNAEGRLYSETATCASWTSTASSAGRPRVGFSWPAGGRQHWISGQDEGGCGAGVNVVQTGGSDPSNPIVGSGGGYGGIYCFALSP